MDWHAAVEPTAAGVRILVEVRPGAARARFPDGFNPWRGRIGVAVRAPPHGGRANREVCSLAATALGVPTHHVRLVAGASDSRKTLAVDGLDVHAARRALEAAL